MRLFSPRIWLIVVALMPLSGVACGEEALSKRFKDDIGPLLRMHCVKCHNVEKHEGGVNFQRLLDAKSPIAERKLWRTAATQLTVGAMPPESERPLTDEQQQTLLAWMQAAADFVDPSITDPGPSLIRRLNRVEYTYTLRDLFGIDFDAAEAVELPHEVGSNGFDNLAAALHVPPALMEKYFLAAEKTLDIVFAPVTPNSPVKLDRPRRRQAEEALAKLLVARPAADVSERAAAEQIIKRFLRRAYRRPATAAELERYLALFETARAKEGASFETATRDMLKPALVSPHFLFRIEQGKMAEAGYHRVSDHELAVRLSYFFWSTMPDEELSRLADADQLHVPEQLEAQVHRLLADRRARAFTERFAEQWLQLEKLKTARPTTEHFPTYTIALRSAMRAETLMFFDKLREEDRSVLELLDCDYVYVNKDLAQHYGISGVNHQELRRVTIEPGVHRGGLLGMGSVLSMTSHTHRTSPTQRGKYILDVIYGQPPPPPPADAGLLKEEANGADAATFREQLAHHARDPSCVSCHKRMDPLGFALDNYNAVGQWRESSAERPLDTSGRLPTGESFNGVAELKQVLLKHQDQFVRNLVEQAFSYAMGRTIVDADEATLRQIQEQVAASEYKFSSLMIGIATSFPFQHRRSLSYPTEEPESGAP